MRSAIVGENRARSRARVRWGLVVAASLLMLGTIALIWLAAVPVGLGVCPAIDPPPTNCSPSYRAGSGMVASVIVLVLYVLAVLAAVFPRPVTRSLVVAGVALLALAPFVSYAAVAWSPGFHLAVTDEPRADAQTAMDDPVGQWGEIAERSAYLTIMEDGTVTGSDGCNGMSGTWRISARNIEFSDMVTSLMMCPQLESDLLGPVVSAVVDGDTMTVLDENGDVTGTLPRAANP